MVAAGGAHTLILADGELWSFGDSFNRQLGNGDRQLQKLPKKVACLNMKRITMIAAGLRHSLVLADGELWSFGWGLYGQLGHGDFANQLLPKKVMTFEGKYVQRITAGFSHSFALVNGELFSFGNAAYGMLGHGDTQKQPTPKKIAAFDGKRI